MIIKYVLLETLVRLAEKRVEVDIDIIQVSQGSVVDQICQDLQLQTLEKAFLISQEYVCNMYE